MLKISFEVLLLVLGVGQFVKGIEGSNCTKKCISGPTSAPEPNPESRTFLPGVDDIYNELPCAMRGGMCVIRSDCPADKILKISGLCPAQQPMNVECCYGVSIRDKRCTKHGGQCVAAASGCSRVVDKSKIDDCAPAEICCILT